MQQLVDKQPAQSSAPHIVNHFAREAGRIDCGTFEIFVPIFGVGNQAAIDILMPKWSAAINAKAIETERVQWELGREIESRFHVLDRFVRLPHTKQAMHDFAS